MPHHWPSLLAPHNRPLLEAAADTPDLTDPAAVARFRRLASPAAVRDAIELTLARRKAADKFTRAHRILADVPAIEQATSADVAAHKAERFAQLAPARIADLCCGIGGDAMALAAIADLLAVDARRDRAFAARHNVELHTGRTPATAVADVTTLRLAGIPFHIDPDRRSARRRRLRYEDYRPGPAFLDHLARNQPAGAIKLSPAVDLENLPPGEVEIINRRGSLVQAVLWTGTLARAPRTATRLPGGATIRGNPDEHQIPFAPPDRYLLAVDPAVERAGLTGLLAHQTGAPAIHPALGLLTAPQPIPSPWLTPFQLLETLPWRPKRVKAALDALGAGLVEVKTRGRAADTDLAQKQLRGSGPHPFTVFILRHDRKLLAHLTRRHQPHT